MQTLKNFFIPHHKNRYRPHAISRSGLALFAIFVLSFQAVYNLNTTGEFRVLGYSTNVSTGDLLSFTNQNRSASGLASLGLNSQLNQAAQAKANHMIANDYWAHVAPDGTTPWVFFAQAGYSYTRAGENLAYGYATSSGIVVGWMNSPSHAANILDSDFTEVGFGIANGANFQGDENTVVVALYARPSAAAPPPPPAAPPEPVTQVPVEPASTTPIETAAAEEPEEELVEEPEIVVEPDSNDDETIGQRYLARLADDGTIIITGSGSQVDGNEQVTTNFDALASGEAHWSLYLVAGAMTTMALIYLMRHLQAIAQLIKNGEHYVEGHPLLEASIIYIGLWLLLFASYGAVL